MEKIVVLDGETLNPGDLDWGPLKELGDVTIYDKTKDEDTHTRIDGCRVVITNKTKITREILEKNPQIEYVGVLATGYNVVDIEACKEYGVTVTNIPSYGTEAVAQFVFALILELCNRVGHHSTRVKEGAWSRAKDFCFWDYPLMELSGKTIGLVGYGRIGQATARIAKAFGLNVLVYDLKKIEEDGIEGVCLEELYSRSHIISLHCPLTEANKKMIDAKTISKMRDGVIIINTSRGPLIDEEALFKGLNEGKIMGAGLDVLREEPPKIDNPLFTLDNCIITPHIAWAPREARDRLLSVAIDNVKGYLEDEIINKIV